MTIERNGSEIIRFDKTRIQNPFKVQKIIERSCKFYGNSTTLARKQRQTALLAFYHKPPILLTPLFNLFFPQHILTDKMKIFG
ncbi:competence protein ComK [Staphylococcus aureus]